MLRFLLATLLPIAAFAAEDGIVGRWVGNRPAANDSLLKPDAGTVVGEIIGSVGFSAKPDALSFDGGKGYVRLSEKGDGLPASALTAEAWVAPRAGGPWGGVFGCLQDNGEFERGWLLGFKDSKWSFAVCSGKKLTYLAAKEEMRLNRWTHVAGTYDGTVMRLYVDGREVAQSKEQSGPVVYVPSEFVLGAYKDANEHYGYDGLLREAALWSRALSAEEVAKRFAEGRAQFPPTMSSVPRPLAGPWVRFTAPDTAVVEWESGDAGAGAVEFGETTALGDLAREPAENVNAGATGPARHVVELRGLKTGAIYYYRLRFAADAAGEILRLETDFNFTRPPLPDVKPYPKDELTERARGIAKDLERHIVNNVGGTGSGYILDYGCGDGRLAWEISRLLPNYSVLGVSSDFASIAKGRTLLDSAGVYGNRLTLLHCDMKKLPLNDNTFDWIVSSDILLSNREPGPVEELVRVLRPGTWFGMTTITPSFLVGSGLVNDLWTQWFRAIGARIEGLELDLDEMREKRQSPLLRWELTDEGGGGRSASISKLVSKGAGAWSHAYGDAGQSTNSGDSIVRGENLALHWFGEPGARGMMDRQPRNPPPLCVNGTFYIQGNDRIFALNAWNGAIRWTLEVPGLRRVNLPRDSSNICADNDCVYAAVRDRALRIDANTGLVSGTFGLPGKEPRQWGYIAVVGEQLFGSTVMPASAYTRFEGGDAFWYDTHGPESTAKVLSDSVFAIDQRAAERTWQYKARGLVINPTISIGGGRVYFVESRGVSLEGTQGRLESPVLYQDAWIVALDAATGKVVWERPAEIGGLGTAEALYLCYSDEKLVLLDSASKQYHTFAFDAKTGAPLWKQAHPWRRDHHGGHLYHPVIARGMVIVEPFGYDLATGEVKMRDMPERGGCSTLSAAADCLHFINWDYDKGSMYVMDFDTNKTRQFSGSRGNCWLSFISGSGMVLLPASSGGCTCRYPNQVTLGFAPRTEAVK